MVKMETGKNKKEFKNGKNKPSTVLSAGEGRGQESNLAVPQRNNGEHNCGIRYGDTGFAVFVFC
jgi:hypothetical protein